MHFISKPYDLKAIETCGSGVVCNIHRTGINYMYVQTCDQQGSCFSV